MPVRLRRRLRRRHAQPHTGNWRVLRQPDHQAARGQVQEQRYDGAIQDRFQG